MAHLLSHAPPAGHRDRFRKSGSWLGAGAGVPKVAASSADCSSSRVSNTKFILMFIVASAGDEVGRGLEEQLGHDHCVTTLATDYRPLSGRQWQSARGLQTHGSAAPLQSPGRTGGAETFN